MLVGSEIDVLAQESDTLCLEPEALFEGETLVGLNETARAEDAVPGEAIAAVSQKFRHLTMVHRVAGRRRDLTVAGDAAARNREDHLAESQLARLLIYWRIELAEAQDVARLHPLRTAAGREGHWAIPEGTTEAHSPR